MRKTLVLALAFDAVDALKMNAPMGPKFNAPAPAFNQLQSRVQTAALGAALATSMAVGPAFAADPWPYSTLVSKVQADEVAKVRSDGIHVAAPGAHTHRPASRRIRHSVAWPWAFGAARGCGRSGGHGNGRRVYGKGSAPNASVPSGHK